MLLLVLLEHVVQFGYFPNVPFKQLAHCDLSPEKLSGARHSSGAHVSDPGFTAVPTGQGVQKIAPRPEEDLPGSHSPHASSALTPPVDLPNLPAGQLSSQTIEPSIEAYEPSGHDEHFSRRILLVNVPAAHG